jgi:hypothetical protein
VIGLVLATALAAGPLAGPLAGWQPLGSPRVFRGAELYGHINGGAELYLELGFEEVEVREIGRGGAVLEIELYRMTDAAAALGAYLARCGKETPAAGLADRHTAGRHQLLLWRERFLVVVNNPTGQSTLAPALVEVAAALSERLPSSPQLDPFSALPAGGRIAGSERIVRGPVGLGAFITLGEGDVLQLATGITAVAAVYDATAREGAHSLLLADYPDAPAAAAAFSHLTSHLDSTIETIRRAEGALDFKDWAGKLGTMRIEGRRLYLRFGIAALPG